MGLPAVILAFATTPFFEVVFAVFDAAAGRVAPAGLLMSSLTAGLMLGVAGNWGTGACGACADARLEASATIAAIAADTSVFIEGPLGWSPGDREVI